MEKLKIHDIVSKPRILLHKSISADVADEIDHVCQVEQQTMSAIEFGIVPTNERKDRMCAERSDSGFSDRSTSSNGFMPNVNAVVTNDALRNQGKIKVDEKVYSDLIQREQVDVKENDTKVNLLKMKLTIMAEAHHDAQSIPSTQTKIIRRLSPPYLVGSSARGNGKMDIIETQHQSIDSSSPIESSRRSSTNEPTDVGAEKPSPILIRSASLRQKRVVDKEPIMRSDFTNTVKMRKKSLESNALREKLVYSPRIILEPIGKVSKLLRRFDSREYSATSTSSDLQIHSPTVETPQSETGLAELNDGVYQNSNAKASQHDENVSETISTPLAAQALSAHSTKSPKLSPNPSKIANPNVKRVTRTKRELANTKSSVHSMDVKTSLTSKLPTDNPLTMNNRLTKQSISFNTYKKSRKPITATKTMEPLLTHRSGKAHPVRTTAYASFNRTSPVRLSGRVKEVTVCNCTIYLLSNLCRHC